MSFRFRRALAPGALAIALFCGLPRPIERTARLSAFLNFDTGAGSGSGGDRQH